MNSLKAVAFLWLCLVFNVSSGGHKKHHHKKHKKRHHMTPSPTEICPDSKFPHFETSHCKDRRRLQESMRKLLAPVCEIAPGGCCCDVAFP